MYTYLLFFQEFVTYLIAPQQFCCVFQRALELPARAHERGCGWACKVSLFGVCTVCVAMAKTFNQKAVQHFHMLKFLSHSLTLTWMLCHHHPRSCLVRNSWMILLVLGFFFGNGPHNIQQHWDREITNVQFVNMEKSLRIFYADS